MLIYVTVQYYILIDCASAVLAYMWIDVKGHYYPICGLMWQYIIICGLM